METKYRFRWLWESELRELDLDPKGMKTRELDTRRGKSTQYRYADPNAAYDLQNTILQMSMKRALVGGVRGYAAMANVFQAGEDGHDQVRKAPPARRAPRQVDAQTSDVKPPPAKANAAAEQTGEHNWGEVRQRLDDLTFDWHQFQMEYLGVPYSEFIESGGTADEAWKMIDDMEAPNDTQEA